MRYLPALLVLLLACNPQEDAVPSADDAATPTETTHVSADAAADAPACRLVEDGFGPAGSAEVGAETVASDLEVPWGLAFLPGGDLLVTERAGRLRLVRDGSLVPDPLATVETASTSEGGLLGLALHPDFASNRLFYLYVTAADGGPTNRVERWRLADDAASAEREQIIFDGIRASRYHNGGRLRFGPDGMLYVGTGDAREPDLAQDIQSPNGALLRLTPDGQIPDDNPLPGSPVFVAGIRNTQGWGWPTADASTLWLTDHGPTGEMGRSGHDEVNVAQAGDNLGWPTIYGCQEEQGLVTPALTWDEAVPPGGATVYTGGAFPEWQGDLLVGTLGSEHLHRVQIEGERVARHAVVLRGEQGRLRTVAMGPDGGLYVTTSNCDGRGSCPASGDEVLRITP